MEVNGAKQLIGYHHSSKYFILCSAEEGNSYWFETTWGWVNYDRIFFFGWTIPLNKPKSQYLLNALDSRPNLFLQNESLL